MAYPMGWAMAYPIFCPYPQNRESPDFRSPVVGISVVTLTIVQWNPVNTVTNGPQKIGRINKGSFTRKCMAVLLDGQKKWQ